MIMDNEVRTTLDYSRAIVWMNDVLKSFYGAETRLSEKTVEIVGQYGFKEIVRLYRYWSNDHSTELRYVVRTIESTVNAILENVN